MKLKPYITHKGEIQHMEIYGYAN